MKITIFELGDCVFEITIEDWNWELGLGLGRKIKIVIKDQDGRFG